jgi:hypothetical protein
MAPSDALWLFTQVLLFVAVFYAVLLFIRMVFTWMTGGAEQGMEWAKLAMEQEKMKRK